MTPTTSCKHNSQNIDPQNRQNYICSDCRVFTQRRCQEIDFDGEQCWLVEGHENHENMRDRNHMVLRITV